MRIVVAVGDEVVDEVLHLIPQLAGGRSILLHGAEVEQVDAELREDAGQAGQPAVSAGEEGGQRLVVMAIEGGDAVRAVVLHALDVAGAAVSQLHAVDDALLCQLLQLDRLELIAAETGVVVKDDVEIIADSLAELLEVVYDGSLVRDEVIRHDDQRALGAALLCELRHLDGLRGAILAGAGINGDLMVDELHEALDDLLLLIVAHGDVLTGGAGHGEAVCAAVQNPLDIALGLFLVEALVSIPESHHGRHNAGTLGLTHGAHISSS